jgi:hypothetical protein
VATPVVESREKVTSPTEDAAPKREKLAIPPSTNGPPKSATKLSASAPAEVESRVRARTWVIRA